MHCHRPHDCAHALLVRRELRLWRIMMHQHSALQSVCEYFRCCSAACRLAQRLRSCVRTLHCHECVHSMQRICRHTFATFDVLQDGHTSGSWLSSSSGSTSNSWSMGRMNSRPVPSVSSKHAVSVRLDPTASLRWQVTGGMGQDCSIFSWIPLNSPCTGHVLVAGYAATWKWASAETVQS